MGASQTSDTREIADAISGYVLIFEEWLELLPLNPFGDIDVFIGGTMICKIIFTE